ncbi:MAG TPA: hypothetical protein PLR07_09165 [Promineifilum sp.]|nr:hypothetical protein [Promineifilum sp.]
MSNGARRLIVSCGVGCIVILVATIPIVKRVTNWLEPARRVPYDIPMKQLVDTQLAALGSQWSQRGRGSLNTDSDFTSGMWAVWLGFDHTDYRYNADEEIHVFYNASRAERNFSPSPMAVNIDKDGNPPIGWTYSPPHADRFVIDCSSEPVPKTCYLLLRYQEYVIVYATDVAGAMTLKDLQKLIEVTDSFMHKFLSETRLEPNVREIPTLSELGLSQEGD